MRLRTVLAVAWSAWLGAATVARADLTGDVNVLTAWRRLPGQYTDDVNPERGTIIAIDPYRAAKYLEVKRLYDLQYDEVRTYRVVPLERLVRLGIREDSDTVILHFANGMRVPVRISDLPELGAFLALEVCSPKGVGCAVSFPTASRSDVYGQDEDPNPIAFSWNKLVVGKPWHPSARRLDSKGFSPWRHVDTLIGLEFVDGLAYAKQFAVGTSQGDKVFLHRCQFCHSARNVGAAFGWDFVNPLPLHEKRAPENLLNHVKYPKAMAQKLGLQMPPQKDVAADEITLLWHWMRDVSRHKLRPYRP